MMACWVDDDQLIVPSWQPKKEAVKKTLLERVLSWIYGHISFTAYEITNIFCNQENKVYKIVLLAK